jgi:hypothetical protein
MLTEYWHGESYNTSRVYNYECFSYESPSDYQSSQWYIEYLYLLFIFSVVQDNERIHVRICSTVHDVPSEAYGTKGKSIFNFESIYTA